MVTLSRFYMKINIATIILSLSTLSVFGQENFEGRKFEQMGTILPTPNSYRTASGAPGHEYWQQKADYVIDVELDDLLLDLASAGQVEQFALDELAAQLLTVDLQRPVDVVARHQRLTQTAERREQCFMLRREFRDSLL